MSNVQSTTEGHYSFFVHSDPTMSSDTSLTVENSNFPKQKRRRTSPRDHAILEAAYLRNSKPDKHERADIVSKVELGEKEVQIWFQNRRQNDRRKSKPLQPHELLAHFRNGLPGQPIQRQTSEEDGKLHTIDMSCGTISDVTRPSSRSSSIHELLNPTSAEPRPAQDDKLKQQRETDPLPTPPSSFEPVEKSDQLPVNTDPTPQVAADVLESTHTRKRSHEMIADNSGLRSNVAPLDDSAMSRQGRNFTRSSSFVRLAMTVDGAVKVRTNNEPTPSPPKHRALPPIVAGKKRESLERSQSLTESSLGFKDITPPIRKVGGAGFGRSRDARTWEFYCDRESGDALSTQAEAERSGSAIGAINLIRSRSQRNKNVALSPNLAKQNSRHVRVDRQNAKPKLARAMSSMARLQTFDGIGETADKEGKRAKHERSPSGDSDKENWAPGTRTSQHRMRRFQPSAPRNSILQESDFPGATDPIKRIIATGQENNTLAGKEKAGGDDLDCIQGLLSLSQGAWR